MYISELLQLRVLSLSSTILPKAKVVHSVKALSLLCYTFEHNYMAKQQLPFHKSSR